MIELRLKLPPSTNNLFRNTSKKERDRANAMGRKVFGRKRTTEYNAWLREAGQEINAQLATAAVKRLECKVVLHIGVVWPDHRRHDISNVIKATEDLLVKHGTIPDDQDTYGLIVDRLGVDKATAGVRVEIKAWSPLKARIAA